MKKKLEKITPMMLAMITIAMIVTIRGLPMLAKYGLSSIFFYAFSAAFFLIPVSLIAAELATAWPEEGGIFLWVTKAFGDKWGFVATFLQWIPIVVWYPTALSFIAASVAYVFDPSLAENKYYAMAVVLIVYWGATFINFKGLKLSGVVSAFCATVGVLIPAALLIGFGAFWLIKGNPSHITFEWGNILPDFSSMQNIVFLAGVLLIFAGMEISAVHVNQIENPRKGYPKVILTAVSAILIINFLGTLAIALVVPKEEISLVAGVLQSFTAFFAQFKFGLLIPIIAIMIAIGPSGQILAMILGPTKSMLVSAKRGDLPPMFAKVNKHNIPVNILIAQGVIVTIFSSTFLFLPDVSSSFWMLSVLTIQLYLIMYMFLYASAIKLRYKYPNVKRPYKVPGGNLGMWITVILAFLTAIGGFFIGYWPSDSISESDYMFFLRFLIIGIIVITSIPLIIYRFKKHWQK